MTLNYLLYAESNIRYVISATNASISSVLQNYRNIGQNILVA